MILLIRCSFACIADKQIPHPNETSQTNTLHAIVEPRVDVTCRSNMCGIVDDVFNISPKQNRYKKNGWDALTTRVFLFL
jgi:hypothetical protein